MMSTHAPYCHHLADSYRPRFSLAVEFLLSVALSDPLSRRSFMKNHF